MAYQDCTGNNPSEHNFRYLRCSSTSIVTEADGATVQEHTDTFYCTRCLHVATEETVRRALPRSAATVGDMLTRMG